MLAQHIQRNETGLLAQQPNRRRFSLVQLHTKRPQLAAVRQQRIQLRQFLRRHLATARTSESP